MRCRAIWDPIELRIRESIPKRFEFGGAKKIVIELGPDDLRKVDYLVLLDVGCYHYADFDPVAFLRSDERARLESILKIVEFVMADLSGRFNAPVPWLWNEIASITTRTCLPFLCWTPMNHIACIIVIGLSLCLGNPEANAEDLDIERGFSNYEAIIDGHKKLSDLSPVEQREVLAIYRAVRSRGSSDDSSECSDARDEAESAASQLADYSRKLMRCAESGDSSNDCSSEFRRVKSAQYDYESTVSTVSSECD